MANQELLTQLLNQNIDEWNLWRFDHLDIKLDLDEADLRGANLSNAYLFGAFMMNADLSNADLSEADLSEAALINSNFRGANLSNAYLGISNFRGADLSEANLSGANLREAVLSGVNLSGANLRGAYLADANLRGTNFSQADLSGADLSGANLSEAELKGTNLTGCRIYATSAWNVLLENTIESNLIITSPFEPSITLDSLEVAQFIYLLLNNVQIRGIINTITSKVVLILGRFTSERKVVLDALREELRKYNFLPVIFDFEKPGSRDFTETIRTLAYLSRFIIADLTDPSSIPQELQAIIPDLAVPIKPLIQSSKKEYAMFQDFQRKYHWVLPVYRYKDQTTLLTSLKEKVIEPAERKAKLLERR